MNADWTIDIPIVKVRRLNCKRKKRVLPALIKKQNNKCYYCKI